MEYLLSGVAILAGVLGIHWLPQAFATDREIGLAVLLVVEAAFVVIVSRQNSGVYRLGSALNSFLLTLIVLVGIQLLGGIQVGMNGVALIAFSALLATLAHPVHTLICLLVVVASVSVGLAQSLFGVLPGIAVTPTPTAPLPDQLLHAFYPVGLTTLFVLVTLGYKRFNPAGNFFGPTGVTGSDANVGGASSMTPSGSAILDRSASVIMTSEGEMVDPTSSQVMSRSYLENLGAQALKEKQGTLESVVYFMSRNFKAYTSIGFLVDETGERLVVNAVVTKSQNFNYDSLLAIGTGIVGSAAQKPAGFITGNLKSYTGQLEYYARAENINSIMVMRVMDVQSKRLQGLLVVDAENIRAFSDEHKELMYRFTQIASVMITHANMSIQMNRQALLADMQFDIAKRLTEALKPDDVLEVLTYGLKRAFEYDRIVLCGYQPTSQRGYVWKVIGPEGVEAGGQEFDVNHPQSLYGSVFRNRRALLIQGFKQEGRMVRLDAEESRDHYPDEVMVAPLLDDRQFLWAVIGIESDKHGRYDQPEFQLFKTIMNNVQLALSKARMYKEMENQATIDGLTQIPNHRTFQEVMSRELERAQRYSSPISLLLMDIDHFKNFNDRYGHPVGDLVLKMVAQAIQGSIRGTDYCARYGGEEFVVVLVQSDEAQALMLGERVRRAVEALQIQNEDQILRVTLSVGSATVPQDAETKQQLIDNADKAMYASKQGGRNRVTPFSQIATKQAQPQNAGGIAH